MRSLLLLLLVAACGRAANGEELAKPPCDGCTLTLPTTKRPLLVVLHGNHESAEDAAHRWRGAAADKRWGVLALACPRALGCDEQARWYRWAGEPDWIFDQLAAIDDRIDRSRVYLVGWSGGASYIGMKAPAWDRRFAAIVFHGGGQPPDDDGACPSLPAYFLVGDENPAHPAAKRLRAYWERCGAEAHWDLLEGANHAREDAALDREKAGAILEWLGTREMPMATALQR
jgi:predicted esterase